MDNVPWWAKVLGFATMALIVYVAVIAVIAYTRALI